VGSFFLAFPPVFLHAFLFYPFVLHALPIPCHLSILIILCEAYKL
jgi:hypothetical protein